MKAKELAKTPIEDLTFCVVDVETTGMNPYHNRVMDLGVVKVKDGKVLEEWEALVDPNQEIPYWITTYTRITDRTVKGKPPFSFYANRLYKDLTEGIFVGHNVGFDYGFLTCEFAREGLDFFVPKLCTVQLSRKLLPQLKNAHLDAVSDHYGIRITDRHRALPDAQATAAILIRFIELAKKRHNAKTYFDLEKLQRIKVERGNRSKNDALLDAIYD